jgi:hypothetical protein
MNNEDNNVHAQSAGKIDCKERIAQNECDAK